MWRTLRTSSLETQLRRIKLTFPKVDIFLGKTKARKIDSRGHRKTGLSIYASLRKLISLLDFFVNF